MQLLLGFLVGLALVAPVGPVSLTLFGLGLEQGRRSALLGAGAVVAVDGIYAPVALGAASMMGALDPRVVRPVEALIGVLLAAVAGALLVGTEQARSAIASIHRPGRTLAALAAINPLTFAAWLGLALALPASIHGTTALTMFGIGLVLASAAWHSALAIGASWLGPRLDDRVRSWIARVSAGVLLAVAGALVL